MVLKLRTTTPPHYPHRAPARPLVRYAYCPVRQFHVIFFKTFLKISFPFCVVCFAQLYLGILHVARRCAPPEAHTLDMATCLGHIPVSCAL
jgi:hypothetical protein